MPPNDQGHQGWGGHRPARRDRRITDLVESVHSHNLVSQSKKQFAQDPNRGIGLEWLDHAQPRPLFTGIVVYAVPYSNCYKVQLDGTGATILATLGDVSHFIPIGPRTTGAIPAHSGVVLWIPRGRLYGIILSAYPVPQHDSTLVCPDWVSQGGQSGIKREKVYKDPFKTLYRQGGIHDFSANRPIDSTTLEWGKMCETGVGLHIDPFMTFLRVNEMCGMWLHYWDSYMRQAALNYDLQTAAHDLVVRDDEGENRLIEHHYVYPWEGIGLYTSGNAVTDEFDDQAVQFDEPKGKIDMADGEEDLQPIARFQEFGGYLGQGRRRLVMIPAKESGKRFYKDDPAEQPDMGVWEETVGLDGTYAMRSAKQLFFVKHCLIPVPKEMRKPEDQKTGDDARQNNYKFSGTFGGGDDHKIKDIKVEGDNKHLLQVAALFDILAFNFNWRPLHPFHYHKEDYQVPQETDISSKSGAPSAVQDFLNFSELSGSMYMSYPAPKQVKVDERYGQVEYFQRQAGWCALPDGSLVLFDGYGSMITMTAGCIRIDCPGDVQLTPGRSLVSLAGDDICLRARNSADLTAGRKNLTLKAERTAMLLGGNQETGGVLIESKAPGFIADFENKIGEEVVCGGIMLKAPKAGVAVWGGEIYLRTGTDGGGEDGLDKGKIVIDAAKGQNKIVLQGVTVEAYANFLFGAYIGPHGDDNNVQAAYQFDTGGAVLDKGLVVDGQCCFLGSIASSGGMVNQSGYSAVSGYPHIGKADGGELAKATSQCHKRVQDAKDFGEESHQSTFPDDLYQEKRPGDDQTIIRAAFSYRDKPGGEQYNTQNFKIAESRWHQMARLNMGSPGSDWNDEKKVKYQGQEQLPYPGKQKWEDEPTLIQLQELKMFDADTRCDKDRPGPYEDPTLSNFEPVPPSQGFKVIVN